MDTRTQLRQKKKMRLKFTLSSLFIILLIILLLLVINWRHIEDQLSQSNDQIAEMTLKPKQKLNVPLFNQFPDLPNGCEVTSLAMLLNYYQIKVTPNELAEKIVHQPLATADGKRGNPNLGFVGSMSQQNGGWCVYNQPLYHLARQYTKRAENASGRDFIQIMHLVSDGHPVMIITTLSFTKVSDMQTWDTDEGEVHVTPSSHACVITGYNKDKGVIYVNDPYGAKNKAVSWRGLQDSYNQQGKQAIYVK